MKTLAELRAEKPAARPERSLTVCLAPHIVAEIQALTGELDSLPSAGSDDPDQAGPPKRAGQGAPPRAREIRERLAVLLAEMAEYEGELRVRSSEDGEWRRWVNEHPAREEKTPGHARDEEVAFGYCNADDLIDSLATYAHSWNAERLAEGDWPILAASIGGPDLKQIATAVVAMHESRLDFRNWRTGLSASLKMFSVSDSPAPTDVPPASSSDESPRSATSTTTPKTD